VRRQWHHYWEQNGNGTTPRPTGPTTVWVGALDDLKVRGYDLSARNLHQNDRKHLPHPAEIMARLLE